MTRSHKRLFLASGLVSFCFLTGCVSTGPQRFGMSFLPPATARQVALTIEPPAVEANPYLATSHVFLKPRLDIPPRPSQVDARIQRANERFTSGKQLYYQGDMIGARLEFDAAIDLLLGTPEEHPDRYKVEAKLEQLVAAIHKFDVNRLGAGDFSTDPSYDKAPLEDILELTFPIDPNLKPRVKEQLMATVSQLPLEMNDSVLSYINFFSGERGRRTLVAGLKRAGRYREIISRILAEEGVPQELIYLAQAESGFLPRAMSHKAAVGMWQFMAARGREYGLNRTPWSDDRLDPEKATRSAARHLRDLYEKFGDWYLAVAGYNCGDGCVERAVQRTGYADFWEIRRRNAIPKETTNYVPIIVAMAIMHKNATAYGIDDVVPDPPLQYETVRMDALTHLALVADAADRPISELRELNPALLKNVAPRDYEVRVPAGTRAEVLAALDTIPAERRASWRIHRVSEGDTIEAIARRYRMAPGSIIAANDTVELDAGDVLVIPTASQVERSKPGAQKVSSRKGSSRGQASVRKPARRRVATLR